MTDRKSLAVISVVTVIACLFALFAGLSAYSNCRDSIVDEKEALDELTERNDKLDEAITLLDKDADKYAALKSDFDTASADYDARLKEHEAAVKEYEETVISFNQDLMTYSVGKGAMSQAGALDEGKAQLASGWDAYNEGVAAFEEGKAQYDQLMSTIERMQKMGVPRVVILGILNTQAGMPITEESIAEMKAGIEEGQAQLDMAKAQLEEGQRQLDSAEQQLRQGQAQINEIGNNMDSNRAGLENSAAEIEESQKALDEAKEKLDAQKEELKKYERAEETVDRGISKLVDSNLAKEGDTPEQALTLARAEQNKLQRAYSIKSVSFKVGLVLLIIDILASLFAISGVAKQNDRRAVRFAAVSAIISVIVCIAAAYRSLGILSLSLVLMLACAVLMILAIRREAKAE